MSDRIDARLGTLAGLVAAVLYAISAFVPGSPMKPDASLADVTAHYEDKRGALLVATMLATIAVALLLWFLGYVRRAIEEVDGPSSALGTITIVSWVGLLVVASVGASLSIAVVWRGAASIDPKLVQLSFDVENLSLYSLTAPLAALSVLAPSLLIWRTGMLPRWLVGIGAIEVAVNVVELVGIGTRHGANAAGYAAGLGPLVWVVWVAALSVLLYRRAFVAVDQRRGSVSTP